MADLVVHVEVVLFVLAFFAAVWAFLFLGEGMHREYADMRDATMVSLGPVVTIVGAIVGFKAWMFIGGK